MNIKRREKIVSTKFVFFDAGKCEACWDCLSACKNKVIGRINLFFHKHALIVNPDLCTSCLKCVKACPHGAFIKK